MGNVKRKITICKQIIEHFNGVPNRQQLKNYICTNINDNPFSTEQLMTAPEEIYKKNTYKITEVEISEEQKRQKRNEYQRAWYAKHREECISKTKKYQQENKDKYNEYHNQWQKENREKMSGYVRKWYHKKKGEVLNG